MLVTLVTNPSAQCRVNFSRNLNNKLFSSQADDFAIFDGRLVVRLGFFFNFIFRAVYLFETDFIFAKCSLALPNFANLGFFFSACLPGGLGEQPFIFILNVFNSTYLRSRFFPRLIKQVYVGVCQQLNHWFSSLTFSFGCSIFLIGLGYKLFFYNQAFYIKLGYCKVIKFPVPDTLQVFAKKRSRFRLFAKDPNVLGNFISTFVRLRFFNFYKGKGIYFLPSFGGIKLKKGKQQQF